jgi:hypothetical protein
MHSRYRKSSRFSVTDLANGLILALILAMALASAFGARQRVQPDDIAQLARTAPSSRV